MQEVIPLKRHDATFVCLDRVLVELSVYDLRQVAVSRIAGLKYVSMNVHTRQTAFKQSLLQAGVLSRPALCKVDPQRRDLGCSHWTSRNLARHSRRAIDPL